MSDRTAFPGQPRAGNEPVFRAPWEAQAFALVVQLHERGMFSWPEWAAALSAELARAGEHDDGTRYYEHWLAALERITAAKRLVTTTELAERKHAWDEAARATPHGQPIMLKPQGA